MQDMGAAQQNTQHQFQDQKELDEAIRLLTETHNNIKSAQGKSIILFAGSTGAGKSTTINLLLGNELKEVEISNNGNEIENASENLADIEVEIKNEESANIATEPTTMKGVDVKNKSQRGPAIGHSGSETIYPSVYDPNGDFAYCDTAGLLDNRSDSHRLNCRFGIGLAIRVAQEFKGLVMVLSYEDLIASRGFIFTNIAKFLLETFKSREWYSSNFLFMVTKFPEEINDFYKSSGKIYDNRISIIIKVLKHLKTSQTETTEGIQVKAVIDILLENVKNIVVLKRTDLLDENKSLKHKQKIDGFFEKAIHPIPKDAVNLGNGDILNEAYLKMFTRIRILGTETINILSEDKQRLIETKHWVNSLWKKSHEANQQVEANQSSIKILEADIKKTETEYNDKIADLQQQKLALPKQLQQLKDQELIQATQALNDRHQQIDAQINQKKNDLLDLLNKQSGNTQTDAETKIRQANQGIANNLQSIKNANDKIQNLKQEIDDQRLYTNNQITIYDQAKDAEIQNKQNEINIWSQDQKPEHQQLQQELTRLNAEIDQKNQAIVQLNTDISSKKDRINQLEGDATHQQVGETLSYNEHSVFGTVQKGVVKEYKLSTHSSDAPLANIDYWGNTSSQSEGSAGYFDERSRSVTANTGQITYYGPSHSYGSAYFRAFARRNDLPVTKSSIATLQHEIKQLATQINDKRREISDLNRDKTYKQNQYSTLKTQAIANLTNDIAALKTEKDTNRDRLDQDFERFKLLKEGEIHVLENDISSLGAANIRLENEKKQYLQLKNVDKIKLIQEKSKITQDADTELNKNNQDKADALKKSQTSIAEDYKEKEKSKIKILDKEITQIETYAKTQLSNYKNQIIFKTADITRDEKFIKETSVDIENGNKIIDESLAAITKSKVTFDEHQNNFIKVIELVKLLKGYRFEGFDEFIAKFSAFSQNYSHDETINLLSDSKKFLQESKDRLSKSPQLGSQPSLIIPAALFYHATPQVAPTSTSHAHANTTTTQSQTSTVMGMGT